MTNMAVRSASDIYWFYPNLTGYARVILTLASFCVPEEPTIFFPLYVASFLMDALDGHLARKYDQCSRFGAVLDMVTDRFSTAILCVILSHLWPVFSRAFMFLIVLDMVSHWFRMYSQLLVGSSSHKAVSADVPALLYVYYNNRIVLGVVCLMNELFYVFLYLFKFYPLMVASDFLPLFAFADFLGPIFLLGIYVNAPVFAVKQVINVIQLIYSCHDVVEWDFQNSYQRAG